MIKIQRLLAPLLTTTLVLAGLTANARLGGVEAASHVEMTPVQIPRWGDTATRKKSDTNVWAQLFNLCHCFH